MKHVQILSQSLSCATSPKTVTDSIPSPIVHCPVWCWQTRAQQGEGGEGRGDELMDDCLSQREKDGGVKRKIKRKWDFIIAQEEGGVVKPSKTTIYIKIQNIENIRIEFF